MSEVKLPRAIRAQAKQAEQIQGQIDAQFAAQSVVPIEALSVPAVVELPVVPPVETPAPVETPVPPAAPVVDLSSQLAQSEQRYRTLQGMMANDVGTLRTQVKDSLAAIQTLTEQLRVQKENPQTAVLNPKDVEAFGEDLVDMVRRQSSVEIRSAVDAHAAAFASRLEAVEQKLQITDQSVAVNAEQQFFAAVTAQVPDWRAVNEDQRFLNWLGEVDVVYGVARQVALDNAVAQGSVERTAAIFSAFKTTVAKPPAPANDLQSQVAPTRSGNAVVAPSTAPAAPQFVSESSITGFYNDMRRGRYKGREAEAAQIEVNINQAIAEGRVR